MYFWDIETSLHVYIELTLLFGCSDLPTYGTDRTCYNHSFDQNDRLIWQSITLRFLYNDLQWKKITAIILPWSVWRYWLWDKSQHKSIMTRCYVNRLTLTVRGPSNLGLTRSISWLLMPWLLTSPGHQQPWYWLCRIYRSWSYMRKDFKYLCQINVE